MDSVLQPPRARARRPAPMLWVSVAVVAVAVGIGAAALGRSLLAGRAPTLSTRVVYMRNGMYGAASWPVGAVRAPAIDTLRDQSGRRFALSSLRGHPVALVFFDSHCHAECPLEGRQISAAERALPASERPRLVVVSVNPKDTRASVRAAIREWGLAGVAPWHWLMGTRSELSKIWAEYGIQVGPAVNGDIAHTEALYLIDRRGFERAAYLWPFESRFATYDMRVLATNRRA